MDKKPKKRQPMKAIRQKYEETRKPVLSPIRLTEPRATEVINNLDIVVKAAKKQNKNTSTRDVIISLIADRAKKIRAQSSKDKQ